MERTSTAVDKVYSPHFGSVDHGTVELSSLKAFRVAVGHNAELSGEQWLSQAGNARFDA